MHTELAGCHRDSAGGGTAELRPAAAYYRFGATVAAGFTSILVAFILSEVRLHAAEIRLEWNEDLVLLSCDDRKGMWYSVSEPVTLIITTHPPYAYHGTL